jgi:flavin reductase (DIM6/NTAB) family NADH-FMN oxidoreductase RutF
MSVAKRSLPLCEVYRLIEPGPVVLVSTMRGGRANIMTMSWHMMVDFEPPILACVMSNRDYSFDALKKTRECVINIPTVELAKKVVACGNTSGRDGGKPDRPPLVLSGPASALLRARKVSASARFAESVLSFTSTVANFCDY